MNFGEMITEVATLVKRPDKVTEIGIAINDAIRHYSIAASFSTDLVEGNINIVATEFAQHIDIATAFPRFRKLKYLARPGKSPLKHIDPVNVILPNGCEQLDKWYRSGNFLYFKLSVLSATLDYGYYTYPTNLVLSANTHWMLDVAPHFIRYKAMADIFDSIGEVEESKRLLAKADSAFLIIRDDLASAETF
jgi:hypothetical protein